MNNNIKKIIVYSLILLGLAVLVVGATYAFFAASETNSGTVKGNTYSLNASLNIEPIKTGNLIPVVDSSMLTSLNGSYPCVDSRSDDYSLCSIYKVTVTNNGTATEFNGYVETNSATSYIASANSNLRYQLFTHSTNYTAVSDIGIMNTTSGSKNYLKSSNNNISISLNDGTSSATQREYYLVIWLHDTNNNQLDDANKSYSGSLVFETLNGGRISSTFTS